MKDDLLLIYRILYRTDEISTSNVIDLARRLNEIIPRAKPYGWKYFDNILRGRQTTGSATIIRAVFTLGAMLDGQSDMQAKARPVTMYTVNGINGNSFIIGLHERDCPECGLTFVGHPSRKYCCDEHGRAYRRKQKCMTADT